MQRRWVLYLDMQLDKYFLINHYFYFFAVANNMDFHKLILKYRGLGVIVVHLCLLTIISKSK